MYTSATVNSWLNSALNHEAAFDDSVDMATAGANQRKVCYILNVHNIIKKKPSFFDYLYEFVYESDVSNGVLFG